MPVVTHLPRSREEWLALRQPNIGASVVGCLLGVHDYQSAYGLWALKSGKLEDDPEETPAMQRGRLLEGVAVKLLREVRPGWTITHNAIPGGAYFVDSDLRLGATPDAFVDDPQRGMGLMQIKSVEPSIFRRKWRDVETGDITPPLWIAVQAIVEAHLTGAKWAAVAALTVGHGLDLHIVDVPIHAGIIDRVQAEVAALWRAVENGRAPDADYGRDGKLIEALYAPEPGSIIDLSADNIISSLCDERETLNTQRNSADKRLKELRAEIIGKLGSAEAARLAGGRLVIVKRSPRAAYQVAASMQTKLVIKQARERAA